MDWYPPMKFKVSSKELFRRTAIVVEIDEKFRGKLHKKLGKRDLPSDYWDFIPIDEEQEESCLKPNKRVLTHAQVLLPKNICCACQFLFVFLENYSLYSFPLVI